MNISPIFKTYLLGDAYSYIKIEDPSDRSFVLLPHGIAFPYIKYSDGTEIWEWCSRGHKINGAAHKTKNRKRYLLNGKDIKINISTLLV